MLDYFFKCCSEAFFGDRLQTNIHISHWAYMPMQITANFVTFPVFSQDIDGIRYEYPQSMCWSKTKKIMLTPVIPVVWL